MAEEIEKLKTRLSEMQGDFIKAIYDAGTVTRVFKLREHPGSCDNEAGYRVTIGAAGDRYRRVKLTDYTQN